MLLSNAHTAEVFSSIFSVRSRHPPYHAGWSTHPRWQPKYICTVSFTGHQNMSMTSLTSWMLSITSRWYRCIRWKCCSYSMLVPGGQWGCWTWKPHPWPRFLPEPRHQRNRWMSLQTASKFQLPPPKPQGRTSHLARHLEKARSPGWLLAGSSTSSEKKNRMKEVTSDSLEKRPSEQKSEPLRHAEALGLQKTPRISHSSLARLIDPERMLSHLRPENRSQISHFPMSTSANHWTIGSRPCR